MKYFYQGYLFGLFLALFPDAVYSQIVPDITVGTKVTPDALINGDRIDGGTIRGGNLFHSFQEFNINTGRNVYFTNPTDVTNIFTRVTGTNSSNINGILGVDGNANFFFMNPNGIVFGVGGSLNVKGSFLGTTASSIHFADGVQFSAVNNQTTPFLTVSVPVGLGFGSNPRSIVVQGTGNNFSEARGVVPSFVRNQSPSGLSVQPGKTLALIGGEIEIAGGVLTAEQGRIELGSLGEASVVSIESINEQFAFGYAGVSNFHDIRFRQRGLADVSGITAGNIQVQGRQISLYGGSLLFGQNSGSKTGGSIRVNASESLDIRGISDNSTLRTAVATETSGLGASGDIAISTKLLTIADGATVTNRSYSSANAGDIRINATDRLLVTGFIRTNSADVSRLMNAAFNTGKAGNLDISTQHFLIQEGGYVASTTFARGDGGRNTVDADNIEISGASPNLNMSTIAASSFGSGNADSLTINTRTLAVRQGGSVSTAGLNNGSAGRLLVNASEAIEVSGKFSSTAVSSIGSSIRVLPPSVRRALGLPDIPQGSAGDVEIDTPRLTVTDGAMVTVTNQGIGGAGVLKIRTGSINLDNRSTIAANTRSGQGGDIFVQTNSAIIRHGSAITTTAGSSGNGGNIDINAGAISLLETSRISANAGQGKGGNITINTQGLFKSPDSNITASGISDGSIKIITPDIKQENALQEQSTNFVSTDKVVADSCLISRNVQQGSFAVTGNGGLPEKPADSLGLTYELVQIKPVNSQNSTIPSKQISDSNIRNWKIGDPIVEAQDLQVVNGRVLLIADNSNQKLEQISNLTCAK
jgi:filamentous hemagglutinin family protein